MSWRAKKTLSSCYVTHSGVGVDTRRRLSFLFGVLSVVPVFGLSVLYYLRRKKML